MNGIVLLIFTSETCGGCKRFKDSGKMGMLKNKLRSIIDIDDITSQSISEDKYNNEFIHLLNKWYPSFYLCTKKSLYDKNAKFEGIVMGGNIKNGEIKIDRSKISLDIDDIINWVTNNINSSNINSSNNYTNYTDYESRLKLLL